MSKEWRKARQRRVFAVLIGMSLFLVAILLRLAWLQLSPVEPVGAGSTRWKAESVAQRERELVLDSGRGDFFDRSGIALTGETYESLAVFPLHDAEARIAGKPGDIMALAGALHVQPNRLARWMQSLKEPAFWRAEGARCPLKLSAKQIGVIRNLRLHGVRILPYRNRYLDGFNAKHAIGYVSQHPELLRMDYGQRLQERTMKLTDQTGGAGLERSLDRLLQGTGPTTVSYFTDGANKPMQGLDWRLNGSANPYYPVRVKTTMDFALQNRLERYVDAERLGEGAVVVLDVDNADIVAMISRPRLPQDKQGGGPEDYVNHAVRAATPGSIFKLVTEAAALESHAANAHESFQCHGNYGRYGLHCWKRGGHGQLTLEEALAGSCNVVFATLAERMNAQELYVTAEKLGIGEQVGWASESAFAPLDKPLRLLPEEEAGHVFAKLPTVRDGGQLAQTGIGQRDVRLSPLQAANLVVTLLHGGSVQEPRLVSDIRYGNGQLLAELPRQTWPSRYGQVSRQTTQTILRGMEAVVAYGTGQSIADGKWAVAGKSGTAQVRLHGTERLNQWFVGYGPVRSPRYAVAVLSENRGVHTSNQATKLFRGVMDILADAEQ
ncbi:peptidoglycan D,D-transpeptidase FtsI family protein [Paenibacillus glycinis]|uniref:Penicillin-binding protein n=1 Tax=Paenibacillus glycinis TaxID=2697035 RepID=A0ABW9XTN1_9BACL|nr:penicillin-binding transpeptidase domain-containing protein [Paenibacillus glycinis]NBD26030.1 penicillin-binding protein [Paenibacillus glycinis]